MNVNNETALISLDYFKLRVKPNTAKREKSNIYPGFVDRADEPGRFS